MRTLLTAVLALTLPAGAGFAAEPWNLPGEKELVVEGKVVDLLCELAGDCPPGCGEGSRQLGLLTAEGRLIPAIKGNVLFAGPVLDLLPFCGRTVQADGLLIENPQMPVYFVQALRERADRPWQPADAFMTAWTAANGEAPEWQRADPLVRDVIARKGKLGVPGLAP
jgi:hypothetical protein